MRILLIDAAIFPAFFKTSVSEVSLQLPYDFIQKDELVLTGEDVHIFRISWSLWFC